MSRFLFVAHVYDSNLSGGRANCRAHYDALSRIFDEGHIISTLSLNFAEKPEPNKTSIRCSNNYLDVVKNVLAGGTHAYNTAAEKIVINSIMTGGGTI